MSQSASAWLEIVERVLGRFYAVENATPDWLVDRETNRRFKVDRLYPELGMAIRFKGSMGGAGAAGLDEMELMEEASRDEARARLCQEAGIALVTIDVDSDAPRQALIEMRTALSAAARRIAQRRVAPQAKLDLLPRIAEAKTTCQQILDAVASSEDLVAFVEAWEDRQFGGGDRPASADYRPGVAVSHPEYGKGLVLRVMPGSSRGNAEIVVQFSDGVMRTFTPMQADRELRRP